MCTSGQYSQNRPVYFVSPITLFHLFNYDNLCKLCEVEALLKAVKGKVPFKILQIKRHEFKRGQIEEIVAQTIPNLRTVDYAVFVVHAAEACLSFSDDSEYGKIYEALKKQTGSGKIEANTIGKKHLVK